MSVLVDGFHGIGRCVVLAAALSLAAAPSALAQNRSSSSLDPVAITVDQAHIMKLPDGVATIVIGNPLIADISIQAGGMAVLTGKGHGMTNLVALDRSGAVLEQKMIQVEGARDSVVVYRGVQRESYSCTPACERRITLGDSSEYFSTTLEQSSARLGKGGQSAAQSK